MAVLSGLYWPQCRMLSEFHGQSFCLRESRRKVLREVPNVSGENHLALSIQGVRDFHPVRDDGLPCLDELGSGRFVDAAVLRQLDCYLCYLCADIALDIPRRCARKPPSRALPLFLPRMTRDVAFAAIPCSLNGPREVLAPFPQHGFVDVQAPSVLVLGFRTRWTWG